MTISILGIAGMNSDSSAVSDTDRTPTVSQHTLPLLPTFEQVAAGDNARDVRSHLSKRESRTCRHVKQVHLVHIERQWHRRLGLRSAFRIDASA